MATAKQINAALKRAKGLSATCVRVLAPWHLDYGKLRPGSRNLTPSKQWQEDRPTDKDLDGISCLRVGYRIPKNSEYDGDEIVIIDADRGGVEEGQDPGEVVVKNPRVVYVYRLRNKREFRR